MNEIEDSRDSLPLDLVQAMDLLAVERTDDYAFIQVAPAPAWAVRILAAQRGQPLSLASAFPYLDRFITEAETFWRDGTERVLLSAPFIAQDGEDELLLRATALNLGPRSVLVIERLRGDADTRGVLQTARDNRLIQERLQRQVDTAKPLVASLGGEIDRLLEGVDDAHRAAADRIKRDLAKLRSTLGP
jgi:hypothetical protein